MSITINKNIAISDTGFVFNPLTGDSFNTNEIGIYIIKSLLAGIPTEELITKMEEEFFTDRITLEKDLEDFILILKTYQIAR